MSEATNLKSATCQIAIDYADAGVSIIPLRLDGSKSPAVPSWKQYQTRIASPDEIRSWFDYRLCGIGVVTGAISGGLEVLDFDQPETFEPWRAATTGIIEWLPTVETAGGGFHVLYRCREICGNTKIAKWEPAKSPYCSQWLQENETRAHCDNQPIKETRIETRGEGGYIVAVGSPAIVHASGKCYVQVLGPPLPTVPTISAEERKALWFAAADFDCGGYVSPKVEQAKRALKQNLYNVRIPEYRPDGDVTPWDDFDRRASWHDILEPHGWQHLSSGKWRRPGKTDQGWSATVGRNGDGVEVLTVFSSNAGVLSSPTSGRVSFGPFRAYAALDHGGDGSEAAKALCKLGYGSASRSAGAA